MGVPASEVGYTSATARRGDHKISYEHVVALGGGELNVFVCFIKYSIMTMWGRYSFEYSPPHH